MKIPGVYDVRVDKRCTIVLTEKKVMLLTFAFGTLKNRGEMCNFAFLIIEIN